MPIALVLQCCYRASNHLRTPVEWWRCRSSFSLLSHKNVLERFALVLSHRVTQATWYLSPCYLNGSSPFACHLIFNIHCDSNWTQTNTILENKKTYTLQCSKTYGLPQLHIKFSAKWWNTLTSFSLDLICRCWIVFRNGSFQIYKVYMKLHLKANANKNVYQVFCYNLCKVSNWRCSKHQNTNSEHSKYFRKNSLVCSKNLMRNTDRLLFKYT